MRTQRLTNLRAVYFARNILRLAVPGSILRARLEPELARLSASELEAALGRVAYYHRARSPFEAGPTARSWDWRLFKKQRNYAFDLIEHLRWFPPDSRVAFRFGDDTDVPLVPTLVKARPIEGDVANSILFPLNKVRHFRFVQDSLHFEDKRDEVVWRGKAYQPHRKLMLAKLHGAAGCNVGRTDDPDGSGRHLEPFLPIRAQLASKFVLSIEGNDVATNLKWILSSNSVCFMRRPRFETWFQEGLLEPGRHYVEVADDYSDVPDLVRFHAGRPALAEKMIRNANDFCARFQDERMERAVALLVVVRYLTSSGQMSTAGLERYLERREIAASV